MYHKIYHETFENSVVYDQSHATCYYIKRLSNHENFIYIILAFHFLQDV